MKTHDNEKTCCDCEIFFILDDEEFGICMQDEAFSPYIDEIFESNYSTCSGLIEQKKMPFDTKACQNFSQLEESKEVITVDLSSEKNLDLLWKLSRENCKNRNVGALKEKLHKSVGKIKEKTIEDLIGLAYFENKEAFELLIEYFKQLPPPTILKEVHYKKYLFTKFKSMPSSFAKEKILIPILVNELETIKSNNTTKSWIAEILDFFKHRPYEMVNEQIEKLLENKKFSHRLKKRFREVLETCEIDEYYDY
ncbi:MAG: hypothetical protein K8S23_04735 [Candidatus Cloacimonetes bacterium]|nr:hypothetical protein [Candidatus Cloacimonadota bacterium]